MKNNKTIFIKDAIIYVVFPVLMIMYVILTVMYFTGTIHNEHILYILYFLWMITSIFVNVSNMFITSNKEEDTVKIQYFNKLRISKKYNMFIIISSVLGLLSFIFFMFNK